MKDKRLVILQKIKAKGGFLVLLWFYSNESWRWFSHRSGSGPPQYWGFSTLTWDMGHSSHQTSLERSSGQSMQENEHSELFSCREILRNPESGRIPQMEREVSQVVLMTVSILETVAQKCVEGRFYEKPYILCHFSVIVTRNIYFSFNAGHLQGDQSISLNSMISSIENRMPFISEFQLWWKWP